MRIPQRHNTLLVRTILSEAVVQRVDSMVQRHSIVVEQLNHPDGTDFSTLGKEMSSLAPIVSLHEKLAALQEELTSVQELLQEATEAGDAEMERECQQDVERITHAQDTMEQRIMMAVLPRDEDDYESDAIVEIRAGTGGDEAALFAAELMETFLQSAKAVKWRVDIMSCSKTDLGGIKEATLHVSGRSTEIMALDDGDDEAIGPYGFFRFESGVHRVQRVPVNDTRIHTSACSVGVLPSLPEANTGALLPTSELKIETMRASGAGGQHVNTTDSAVRITHIPTGLTASIQDERSQHKNKAKALKLIAARVRQHVQQQEDQARGAERSSLMGGGDRSERIRTYNFPQDRVTDHRCKHSTHGLEKLLQGGIDGGLVATFFPVMRQKYKEELMKELESDQSN
ncbi:Peptide chain release factor 1 [Seminavis robusta]|uniref:Peptide chain release factor 1 n=1 Tax=Seminavis robusta TaxID=568900 RepID=A0A9N8ETQ7_9STRA|nr:Peptide chain release factor 1 [Seminavis robusta]|eukprot:Sro2121_g315450.1 Peptide chain release factor 1 (400) ;mRNA; r:5351-6550